MWIHDIHVCRYGSILRWGGNGLKRPIPQHENTQWIKQTSFASARLHTFTIISCLTLGETSHFGGYCASLLWLPLVGWKIVARTNQTEDVSSWCVITAGNQTHFHVSLSICSTAPESSWNLKILIFSSQSSFLKKAISQLKLFKCYSIYLHRGHWLSIEGVKKLWQAIYISDRPWSAGSMFNILAVAEPSGTASSRFCGSVFWPQNQNDFSVVFIIGNVIFLGVLSITTDQKATYQKKEAYILTFDQPVGFQSFLQRPWFRGQEARFHCRSWWHFAAARWRRRGRTPESSSERTKTPGRGPPGTTGWWG